MALHFAVNGYDKADSPRVFVLDPYSLEKKLEQDQQVRDAKKARRRHLKRHRKSRRSKWDWYDIYLPVWLRNRHLASKVLMVEIRIRSYFVEQIRIELREAGITESVIYPDLDGLGREMVHEWKARPR
jgi:hypothetical protein